MSSKFQVVPKGNGMFSVENETEVLAVMESRAAAELACQQLNYEPGRNPCDVFMQGRWSDSKAARQRPTYQSNEEAA